MLLAVLVLVKYSSASFLFGNQQNNLSLVENHCSKFLQAEEPKTSRFLAPKPTLIFEQHTFIVVRFPGLIHSSSVLAHIALSPGTSGQLEFLARDFERPQFEIGLSLLLSVEDVCVIKEYSSAFIPEGLLLPSAEDLTAPKDFSVLTGDGSVQRLPPGASLAPQSQVSWMT